MRYAIVKDSLVTNIILWDGISEYSPPEDAVLIIAPDEVVVGWTCPNGTWTPPEPSEPIPAPGDDTEDKLQGVQALVALGIEEAIARTIVGLSAQP